MYRVLTGVLVVLAMLGAAGKGLAEAKNSADDKVLMKVNAFVDDRLLKMDFGRNPKIVAAVKAENAKGKTMKQIKELDAQWQAAPGITGFMLNLLHNDCSLFLRTIQRSVNWYGEIFVMDNQGALVAMTDKTSDYWQGDEAKFTESVKGDKGAVFIDKIKFDPSSRKNLVQVSIPVMDKDIAIGAIMFGIDTDRIN